MRIKKKEVIMDKKEIGRRLRLLRGVFRTQQTVADDLGISANALGMYERGDRIPPDETKLALAKYYGTTVQAIFFDENDTERVTQED
jgi:DNA-binding XRE family transcriptional regulator